MPIIEIFAPELLSILSDIAADKPTCACSRKPAPSEDIYIPLPKSHVGHYCPSISRVIFNGDSTIVLFADGTKSIVKREPNDPVDKTTAIAYAIVKRLLGTAVNAKSNAVNSAYIGAIHSLADHAYDQANEAAINAQKNKEAQAKHEARQAAEQKKAFDRLVKRRVKEMQVEAAAKAMVDGSKKQPLNESMATTKPAPTSKCDGWKSYTRPNKPFSKFTEKEKKEYWSYHNAKRRASRH